MAVLIDVNTTRADLSRDTAARLAERLPGVEIRAHGDDFPAEEIEVLVTTRLRRGLCAELPNLRLIQKMGAGVDTMLNSDELPPHVRVTRLKPEGQAQDMAEWALSWVMAEQRSHRLYAAANEKREWATGPVRLATRATAAVLGLGAVGSRAAAMLSAVGFRTLGWSRTPRDLPGVDCRHGPEALDPLLAEADYVVAVLPSTPETIELFDAGRLAAMKEGSVLLNMGRGDLIDDAALLAALDAGRPARAILDVFRTEPLPPEHPFWNHPAVMVTPHVAGRHIAGALETAAANIKALAEGTPLLHEVDRERGY